MSPSKVRRNSVFQGFGIRDGHGIVFVSQKGDVYPSGFLPVVAGNVREGQLSDIYRSSPVFQRLHNPNQFEGPCDDCEYGKICGGSRERFRLYGIAL